jgi:membrane-associated phospholipid phosphatase
MRALRSAVLNAPRHWIAWGVGLFAVVVVLGFAVRFLPSLATPQLGLIDAINRQNSAALDSVARALDLLDHPVVVAVILVVLFLILWATVSWRRGLGVCVVTGAGWVTCLVTKYVVHQPRPSTASLTHPVDITPSTLSYPSGHVAFIAALAVALMAVAGTRGLRFVIGIIAAVFVLIVGWSRLYLGLHYPTDVVGGVLNGVAGTLLMLGLWNLLARTWEARSAPAEAPE